MHKENPDEGWKGSYTVEAAAVVSMTFLVLAALMMCTFFVHDRAVLQSMVCEAAAAGGNHMTQEERCEQSAAVTEELSEKRMLGSRRVSAGVQIGEESTAVKGTAAFPVPGLLAGWMSGSTWNLSCSWETRIYNPAEIIRKIRGAELVLEGLKEE